MAKKIKTETALGIIFLLAIGVAGSIYFLSRQDFAIANKIFKNKKTVATNSKSRDLRLLFASNGEKNVYKVQKGDKWAVEIDGVEGAAYDDVANPAFSPDGSQFAYSATLNSQSFVVVGQEVQRQVYDRILQIIFSSDGRTLGYVAQKGNYNVVVLNGQEGKTYQEISQLPTSSGSTYIIFSPDGQSIAYKVVDDKGTYMVVNGKAGQTYSDIISFVFSPDGSQFTYQAQSGGQNITVVNNQEVTSPGNTSGNTSGTNTNTSGQSSGSSSTSTTNRRRNTKDVHLDQSRLFYPSCDSSGGCNF